MADGELSLANVSSSKRQRVGPPVPPEVGRCAWLTGLGNNPGLNGRQGNILAVSQDGSGDRRIVLKLDQPNQPHQQVSVKPENISFAPPAGTAAEVIDLTGP